MAQRQDPQSAPEAEAPDQGLALLIVRASRFARAASRYKGRERSSVALRTLSNLRVRGAMRIGDLATAEHITQPTMTGVIKRLEAEGLVVRTEDPEDGRAFLISVTPRGLAALDEFRVRAAERVRPVVEELSAEDRAVLDRASELLEQMTESLDD